MTTEAELADWQRILPLETRTGDAIKPSFGRALPLLADPSRKWCHPRAMSEMHLPA